MPELLRLVQNEARNPHLKPGIPSRWLQTGSLGFSRHYGHLYGGVLPRDYGLKKKSTFNSFKNFYCEMFCISGTRNNVINHHSCIFLTGSEIECDKVTVLKVTGIVRVPFHDIALLPNDCPKSWTFLHSFSKQILATCTFQNSM